MTEPRTIEAGRLLMNPEAAHIPGLRAQLARIEVEAVAAERARIAALYEIGAMLAKQWAEVCAALGLPDDVGSAEVIEAIRGCPPECVHDDDCAVARALLEEKS